MQTARTPLDHTYAIVRLDALEMDKIAQVNLMHIIAVHMYVVVMYYLRTTHPKQYGGKNYTPQTIWRFGK